MRIADSNIHRFLSLVHRVHVSYIFLLLIVVMETVLLKSDFSELDHLKLQFIDAFLLLISHTQVAETVEQLTSLFLPLQTQVLREEGDVVFLRV
jgi:hypothetical protein